MTTQDKRATKKTKVDVDEDKQEQTLKDALDIQEQIDENNAKLEEEVEKLKQKYEKLNAPLFKKRSEHTQKIDQFWARVFVTHDLISELLTEKDVEALSACKDVTVETKKSDDEKETFTVTLTFGNNPFFEDTKLTKAVTVGPMEAEIAEQEEEDEFIPPLVESTQSGIKWKSGQKFTADNEGDNDENEKPKSNKNDDKKRKREEKEEKSTFFAFFESETPMDEDILEAIMTDIVPNPMDYYLASGDESEDEGDVDSNEEEQAEEMAEKEEEKKEEEKPLSKKQQKKQKKQQQQQSPAAEKKETPKKQETPKGEQKKGEQKKQETPKSEQKKQTPPKSDQKKGGQQKSPNGKQGAKQQQKGAQQQDE